MWALPDEFVCYFLLNIHLVIPKYYQSYFVDCSFSLVCRRTFLLLVQKIALYKLHIQNLENTTKKRRWKNPSPLLLYSSICRDYLSNSPTDLRTCILVAASFSASEYNSSACSGFVLVRDLYLLSLLMKS